MDSTKIMVQGKTLSVLLAKDGQEYGAFCPELDLVTEMDTPEGAIEDLIESKPSATFYSTMECIGRVNACQATGRFIVVNIVTDDVLQNLLSWKLCDNFEIPMHIFRRRSNYEKEKLWMEGAYITFIRSRLL
ncbi:MAG: hypothetical protein ACE5GV_15545 [Candidatus Scalindua sp.]